MKYLLLLFVLFIISQVTVFFFFLGYEVSTIDDTLAEARIYVTATGCKSILRPHHFENMLEDTIVCNIGHFDCEIDIAWLNANCVKKEVIKPQASFSANI